MLDVGKGTPLYCETCFQELLSKISMYECNYINKNDVIKLLTNCNNVLYMQNLDYDQRIDMLSRLVYDYYMELTGGNKK